ncbi:LuxR C-terminal-related transcriptional regulator [uncultured Maritimibacter sp.]|jgi:DNA-binding NarL/FixJ family response regulator|uniref:response regulator transcription factor n=1 Tax=uncultured Maritimibacter sp. TaxID=991866 RepID=UPI002618214D|nr:LuxR C-terminal-related transcriptional regulator [uncultured Maritimibacter sp.]
MRAPIRSKSDPIDTLTAREEQILRRVAKGLSKREFANELSLREKTIKHYMSEILGKLQARNRVEAAIMAHEAWRLK